MSATPRAGSSIVPWSYRTYRAVILLLFVAILLLLGLGVAGHGPVHVLHGLTNTAVLWVKKTMGIEPHV